MIKNVDNVITHISVPEQDGVMLYPNKVMYENVCVYDKDNIGDETKPQQYMLFIFQSTKGNQSYQTFTFKGKRYYYGDRYILVKNGDKLYDYYNENEIFEFNISKFDNDIKKCWITYGESEGVVINNPNHKASDSIVNQVANIEMTKNVVVAIDSNLQNSWGIECGDFKRYFNKYSNSDSSNNIPLRGRWFEFTVNYPDSLTFYRGFNSYVLKYDELQIINKITLKNAGNLVTSTSVGYNNINSKSDIHTFHLNYLNNGVNHNTFLPIQEIEDLNYRLTEPKLVTSELHGGYLTYIPVDENGRILFNIYFDGEYYRYSLYRGYIDEWHFFVKTIPYNTTTIFRTDYPFFTLYKADVNTIDSSNNNYLTNNLNSFQTDKFKVYIETKSKFWFEYPYMEQIRSSIANYELEDLEGKILMIPFVINKGLIEQTNS